MDQVRIHPLGARVLIKPEQSGESLPIRGIYIPEMTNEQPLCGEVVAVGDQEDDIKVKIGNRVLYPKNSGIEVYDDDILYVIIDAKDILAIIKD
ncbi:MAG: co-chaperone GroES [Anaerolineales bacterium]|nr:co-chaperone GroES [Anaerolineales bacterium]